MWYKTFMYLVSDNNVMRYCLYLQQSGFCIINISLIRLILGSQVLAFKGSKIYNVHIFDFSTVNTFEPNISLITLILIMQNLEWHT